MLRRLLVVSVATALAACSDATGPKESGKRVDARTSLVDARNGGASGFWFLPPISADVPRGGVFDPSRLPVVEICALTSSGCGDLYARYTTTGGPGTERIRVSVSDEQYIVAWHTRQTGVAAGATYRVRVLDGATELGHADVKVIEKGSEAKSVPEGTLSLVFGATLPIKFRLEAVAGGQVERIEIHPATFLLPGSGATLPLEVRAYDANGQQVTPGQLSWVSSRPSVIGVSSAGIATAISSAGSAQVTVHAGDVISAPALALVAQTASGAMIINDDNVLSPPAQISGSLSQQASMVSVASATVPMVPVDMTAPYQPGWRYKIWLGGVTPSVGQIVVSGGESAIGGRVVAIAPSGENVEVTLELVPLAELLPGLSIDERFALEVDYFDVPAAIHAGFKVTRSPDGRVAFDPRPTFGFAVGLGGTMTTASILDTELKFEVGPFECKVVSSGAPARPVVSNYSYHVDPDLTFDLAYSPSGGFQKVLVRGVIDAGVAVTQRYSAQVEQKLECEIELGSLPLPVSGPLALFIGGSVGVGVGFELGGKLGVGDIGVEASVSAGASVTMGLDYVSGAGPFATIDGSSPRTTFTLLYPDNADDLRSEFSAGAFVAAKLNVGSLYFDDLKFELYGVKAGPKQAFQLATTTAQVSDPAYASSVKTSFDLEAATGGDLTQLGNLLGLNMAALKFEHSTPLAQTPRIQSFVISPEFVGATTSSDPGEEANFILTLDPVTYMGAYAIDSIELFRKKPTTPGNFVLEKVPGDCGQFAPLPGQSAFSCETVLPSTWVGEQTVYAFVKARVFGASIPLLLELGDDAMATVNVDTVSIVITPADTTVGIGNTRQFAATVTGLVIEDVTWTATGGTISSTGLYTAGDIPGNYEVVATSVDDPTVKATAAVRVEGDISVSVTPGTVTLGARGVQQFAAEVNGSPSTLVSWRTTDPGGTVTAAGLYTAGTTAGVFEVVATSLIDPAAEDAAEVSVIDLRNLTTDSQMFVTAHGDPYGATNCNYHVRAPGGALSFADAHSCQSSGATPDASSSATGSANQAWSVIVEPGGSYLFAFSGRAEGSISGSGNLTPTGSASHNVQICFNTQRTWNYEISGTLSAKVGANDDSGIAQFSLAIPPGSPNDRIIYNRFVGRNSALGGSATLDAIGTISGGTYCMSASAYGGGFVGTLPLTARDGFAELGNVQLRLRP